MKHLIQLWPDNWVKHMAKTNEAVGAKNRFTMDEGVKRLFSPLKRQEFWKFIGCILLEFTYGKKGHKRFSEITKYFCRMVPPKLRRDVRGNTNLYRVCCAHYCHFYIYDCY